MFKCPHPVIAVRVHRRTIDMIEHLDDSVKLEIDEGRYFMIYCVDSDHEEYETIAPATYDRTYTPMDGHVLAAFVTTID